MSSKFLPAILIVSDTASQDPSTDKAAPILREVLTTGDQADKWHSPLVEIVPDSIPDIQRVVTRWTDYPAEVDGHDATVNLIITTGGTGFATKDWTPEAISPLLHRHAPGLVQGMLNASLQVTPFAMMSRPVAGVRNKTLVVTLPGSPKGAKENLEAIVKLMPHACKQAAGEDSRAAHVGGVKKLEQDAGVGVNGAKDAQHTHNHDHSHSHGHDHGHGGHQVPKPHTTPAERVAQSNDPRLGASHRARESPYPMLSVQDAVAKIIHHSPAPVATTRQLAPDLVGSVISEDIYSAEAVPAYRASIVDGYAIIIPDEKYDGSPGIKGEYPVASVSHAQASSLPPPLKMGEVARITTGAPLPEYANAVVMVEDTLVTGTTPDGTEEKTISILTSSIKPGENVREPGSDIALNSLILPHGTRITSIGGEIGMLAASGIHSVPVYRKPRVGVMSTGDEVTDISFTGTLQGGQIRDSNRPSLLSLIRGWNLCEVIDLGIARDTPHSELEHKLRDAFSAHDVDVVITTGGVSMGELDLLKPTIERGLGGTIHFGRVSMKPGKPTTFASVPSEGVRDTPSNGNDGNDSNNDANNNDNSSRTRPRLIFGLPGNPASAIVTAHLFLLPSLQKLCGLEGKGLERVHVKVATRLRSDPQRVEYHRAVVSFDRADGKLVARSTGMQRSSRVGSLATSNALLELPLREGWVEEGGTCEALLMGPILGGLP